VPIDLDDAVEDDDFAASPAAAHRSDVRRGFDPGFAIDPDGDSDDGALDEDAKAAVDEDLNVITADLRQQLRDKKRRGAGYLNLFQYLFFCMFYFVVVFIQADVYDAYSVVSSVRRAVVPLDGDGFPVTSMANPTQILDWLVETAFPVWVDEVCGDGTCNEPFEFPAYGRFGCRADCGSNTNLTTMLLQVRADFRDDLYSPRALMSAAAWNLCKRDEAAKKAGFPDVCWWEDDRVFSKVVENHLETVNVPPNELWFVSIKGDYMGRVVGNVFIAENNSLPWVGTVPEWKACARNVVSARREVATTNARRMLLDVDKHDEAHGHEDVSARKQLQGESFEAIKKRVLSHKRRAAPGESVQELLKASSSSRRKLQGGAAAAVGAAVESALDWIDEQAEDFVDFWSGRESAPAPAAPVMLKTTPTRVQPESAPASAPTPTLAKKDTDSRERRVLLGDREDAFVFDGHNAATVKSVYDNNEWGAALLQSEKMTFEAWIKPDAGSSFGGKTLAMSGNFGWAIMLVCGGADAGCCGTHTTGAVAFFYGQSTANPGDECANMPSSDSGVPLDVWTHVAVTVDVAANVVAFYLNGEPAGVVENHELSLPMGGTATDADFHFGCSAPSCSSGSCGCFEGGMDDMRVWNKALSAASVAEWHANRAEGVFTSHPDQTPVARYDAADAFQNMIADGGMELRVSNSATSTSTGDMIFPVTSGGLPPIAVYVKDQTAMSLDFSADTATSVYKTDDAAFKQAVNASGELTVEAWIKTSSVNSAQMIVSQGETGWAVMLVCGGTGVGCCGTHANGAVAFVSSQTAGECANLPASATVVEVDVWTHVAVAVDANAEVVHFFVNGVSAIADAVNAPGVYLGYGVADTVGMAFGGVLGCDACMRLDGYLHAVQIWKTFLGHGSFSELGIGSRKALVGAIAALGDETADDHGRYDRLLTFVASDAHGIANGVVAERSLAAGEVKLQNARYALDAPNDGRGVFENYVGTDAPSAAFFAFNGISSYGVVPFSEAISFDATDGARAMTFEAWIAPSGMPEAMVIAAMDDEGWAIFKHCNSPAGSSQMGCCEGHTPNALVFWPGNASATSATFCESIVSTVAPLQMDEWEHISVAVDVASDRLDIFFDGVKQTLNSTGGDASIQTRLASFTSHASDPGSSGGMGIGMRPGCTQDCLYYNGSVAAVRVWNAAVPPAYRGVSENAIPKEDAHHLVGSFRLVEGRDDVAPNAALGLDRANDMQLIDVLADDSRLALPAGYGVPAPSAFVFDGETTIVVEENAATVALMPTDGSMTFEAWIHPDVVDSASRPTVEVIATMGDWGWTLILIGSDGGGSSNYPNVPYDTLAFFEGSSSSNVWDFGDIHYYALSNETVPRGVWSHVAVRTTWSGTALTVDFFIDGRNVGTGLHGGVVSPTNSLDAGGTDASLKLGGAEHCSTGSHCYGYHGLMDVVRLWNDAVPESYLVASYDETVYPFHPALDAMIFEFSFDDAPAGDAVLDRSANRKHAVVHLTSWSSCVHDATSESTCTTPYTSAEFAATRSSTHDVELKPGTLYKADRALYFDGVDGRHDIGGSDALTAFAPLAALTFDAWVYPDVSSAGSGAMIASYGSGFEGWGVQLMCVAANGEGCCPTGSHVDGSIGFFAKGAASCDDFASSSVAVPRGEWTHIAVTVTPGGGVYGNETLVSFYVGGVSAGETITAFSLDFADVTFTGGDPTLGIGGAGGCADGGCFPFVGSMDTVRVWNTTIIAEAVPVLADGPTYDGFPFAEHVVAEFTFDSGARATAGNLSLTVPETSYVALFATDIAEPFGDAAPFSEGGSLVLDATSPIWVRTSGGAARGSES
jgi:hypothetical protein